MDASLIMADRRCDVCNNKAQHWVSRSVNKNILTHVNLCEKHYALYRLFEDPGLSDTNKLIMLNYMKN